MFSSALLSWTLLALLASAWAQTAPCDNAERRDENPLGSCACAGHLWIGPGCEDGYWCEDELGNGCYKVPRQF